MEEADTTHVILLVDDEENILRSLRRLLVAEDYDVLTATSGKEGLALLAEHSVALIISDQRMPAMTGSEFLAQAKETNPEAIRIMLTGYSDIDSTMAAINEGEIYKYVTKPWRDEELLGVVREGLERFSLLKENKRLTALTQEQNEKLTQWNDQLEQRVEEQTHDIKKRNKALLLLNDRLKNNFNSCLEAFASLIELRDPGFSNHSRNVAELSRRCALSMGLEPKDVETIRAAALLHDIGKIGIPDAILQKERSELTAEEQKNVQQHPIRGQAAIAHIESLRTAGELIRHHHEKMNGSGYPDGLAAESIPLGARIIAVADSIDLLATGRHGEKCELENALKLVMAMAGTKLDPEVIKAMQPVIAELAATVHRAIGSCEDEYLPRDLSAGMTVSRDVRSGTGVLILPAGTTLTMDNIEHLKRMFTFDPAQGLIYIMKKQVF